MDPKLFFPSHYLRILVMYPFVLSLFSSFSKRSSIQLEGATDPSVNKKATFPSNFVNGCLAGQAHFFNLFYFLLVALMIWSQKNRSFRKNNLPHGYQK